MLTALDVANFFIDLANQNPQNEEGVTNLRVNKLVYFAQVLSLVRHNKPLFTEEIEAWKYGPVIPTVYYQFKQYGDQRIKDTCGPYSADNLSDDELELLLDVVRNYDQYSSWKLAELTHTEGGPWESVYKPHAPNGLITQDSLKEYYSDLDSKLDTFKLTYNPDTDVIGYRNNAGYLVLPKEYNDDTYTA
ncbi:MAG TPA: DUF4065 domain-containing protein [Methanocorpusculum sp.]|nr:DUF4065 domain-containing protein [Methanocorpusculum sp.]